MSNINIFNIFFEFLKILKKQSKAANANEIAKEIVASIQNNDIIEKVEIILKRICKFLLK